MNHLGLFEGIGGFSLAARWMGWNTIAWCEWNLFCQKVLKHHFPNAEGHGNIKKTDFTKYAGKIDILTGGFPCQPYSTAGLRKGKEDERHLWPEMLRAIREVSPRYVVGENVRGLTNWNGGLVFDEVQADLEAAGYEVLPFLLPACGVNAPHRRDRIWFIAHSASNGHCNQHRQSKSTQRKEQVKEQWKKRNEEVWERDGAHSERINVEGASSNSNSVQRRERGLYKAGPKQAKRHVGAFDSRHCRGGWQNFPTQPPVCSGDDGLPKQLDGITFSKWRNESIKAYGNAIVPQVAFQIFKSIQQLENNI